MIGRIARCSRILTQHLHKHFEDCAWHFRALTRVLAKGAAARHVVGNSAFYDAMMPTELLHAGLLRQHSFTGVKVEYSRKGNSKKELFEFVGSGRFGP